MLVFTRKSGDQIQIGPDIVLTVVKVKGGAVRIGVDAPRNVAVARKELHREIKSHADTFSDTHQATEPTAAKR